MPAAKVDQDTCIGCGTCAALCPEVFRLTEDGKSEVHTPVAPATAECARDAYDSCPVGAISLDES